MQLPHRLVVITPTETTDAYDNPVPHFEYGTGAALLRWLFPDTTASEAAHVVLPHGADVKGTR